MGARTKQNQQGKKGVGLPSGLECLWCLLDDNYALHPQMDVAVVVVGARRCEAERIGVATRESGATEGWEAYIRC